MMPAESNSYTGAHAIVSRVGELVINAAARFTQAGLRVQLALCVLVTAICACATLVGRHLVCCATGSGGRYKAAQIFPEVSTLPVSDDELDTEQPEDVLGVLPAHPSEVDEHDAEALLRMDNDDAASAVSCCQAPAEHHVATKYGVGAGCRGEGGGRAAPLRRATATARQSAALDVDEEDGVGGFIARRLTAAVSTRPAVG